MITRFGMSKKFGLMGLATVESQYLEGRASLTCSDVTAADIDTEVMKMLRDSYKQAKKLLKENREIMDKLAAYLIEKETITGKEFMKIFRKEKGLPEPEENEEEGEKSEKSPQTAETQPAGQPQGQSVEQPQQQPVTGQQPFPQQQPVPNQQWGQQPVPNPQWGQQTMPQQPMSGQQSAPVNGQQSIPQPQHPMQQPQNPQQNSENQQQSPQQWGDHYV